MRGATASKMSAVGVQGNFFIEFSSALLPPPFLPSPSALLPSPLLSSCFLHPPPPAATDVISHDLQSNAINPDRLTRV